MIFRDTKPEGTRNVLESGFLYSGGDDADLDEGVFAWDYVTYLNYRHRFGEKDWLSLRHQYWKFLDNNYRNSYQVGWWRQFNPRQAISVSSYFLDEMEGYQAASVYFGYQDYVLKDMKYYIQAGGGRDNNQEWHGDLYVEAIKPLTRSTLLRLRNEYVQSTTHYRSDTFRINLIQALHRRLALNLGYRYFANNQANRLFDDLTSHSVSSMLTWQAREDLFLMGGYRRYWNSADTTANAWTVESRWNVSEDFSLVAGYRLQHYDNGPFDHGFRVGVAYSF